jgi:hypothetical protein
MWFWSFMDNGQLSYKGFQSCWNSIVDGARTVVQWTLHRKAWHIQLWGDNVGAVFFKMPVGWCQTNSRTSDRRVRAPRINQQSRMFPLLVVNCLLNKIMCPTYSFPCNKFCTEMCRFMCWFHLSSSVLNRCACLLMENSLLQVLVFSLL